MILRWIFRKWDGIDWIELAQDRDRWQEPSGYIKCRGFLDTLKTSWLLKKDSVPWSK
jgi:hypothetical protein